MVNSPMVNNTMYRCLHLARQGQQNARPNPMVGAVIVDAEGNIIGEGYHIRCGEAHAEVNAFADCSRRGNDHLLPEATIYVSLEPCAHYGKTPPCADLIIKKGVRKVVVGCVDTFSEVSGRGIQRIREAGIEVEVGVLEDECRWLNRTFFTYHTLHRPFITLKWAMSADGFLDKDYSPVMLSNEKTQMLSHKLRAENDAILVGRTTYLRDHPSLTVRHWYGQNPVPFVLTHHPEEVEGMNAISLDALADGATLGSILDEAAGKPVQSLIVEGGADTHRFFIDNGLWDIIRVERSPELLHNGTKAPVLPQNTAFLSEKVYDRNIISEYRRGDFFSTFCYM
ncbi:MAG: bifunctional diaminohydroxyphosphoribosylaminopyrimidine deaminase/5-amino-6-(5-phosphoribosylamino)uracil reductase RibD [Bacteroidaceae bacterium]|nr:bifunctional diaminohydroxyphosphoribosylaminopyrimidine deaminase/5-amino-6-(5-phosphoribosylamino)uracil reductase RibD [Bacteroidaceae bacterium]